MQLMLSCGIEQDFPQYQPQPVQKNKTLNLLFLDQADPLANVLIYVDGKLVDKDNPAQGGRTTTGFLKYTIPDSLFNRTFTITLAESNDAAPPSQLNVNNRIYETFLLPTELFHINTLVFTRKDVSSSVHVARLGISAEETAPSPGYFKVRFLNLTQGKINISRRNGLPVKEFINLNILEEKPFIELPFGEYRFFASTLNGNFLYKVPPLLRGAAGKCYTVLCTTDGQYIAENADFGLPSQSWAHVAFVNLYSNTESVTLLPFTSGVRQFQEKKELGVLSSPDMILSGENVLAVKVGETELKTTLMVNPYEYATVLLVNRSGRPQVEVLSTPMMESRGEDEAFCRFMNYTSDISRISFTQIIPTLGAESSTDEFSTLINAPYTANLAFGEVRTTTLRNRANLPYISYPAFAESGELQAPLIIQANKVTDNPLFVADPIQGTRTEYPFFFKKPKINPLGHSGQRVEPGVYTVVLAGESGDQAEIKTRLFILNHSF
jgi:hypothetical protein